MNAFENKLSTASADVLPTGQANVDFKLQLVSQTESTEKPFVRLFEARDERLMIGLGLVGIALTLGFWLLGRFHITIQITDLHQYLSSLIFLDSVHVVFTFVLMLSVPELRAWSKSKETKAKSGWLKGLGPWARFFAIAAALGLIIWVLKVNPGTKTLTGMVSLFLFFELLGPSHHTLAQMKSISLTYNSSLRKKFKFSEEQAAMAGTCEKMERLFFHGLLAGELIYWMPELLKTEFDIPQVASFQLVGACLALGSAVALIVNSLYFPHQDKSNKLAFMARALLFPLKMLSIISGLSVRAAHGTEYFVVYRKMVKSSNVSKVKKSRIFWLTALASLIYLVPFTIMGHGLVYKVTGFQLPDRLLATALIGTFIVRFTHYYMDSVLFRMSDKATRQAVSPLLTAEPTE